MDKGLLKTVDKDTVLHEANRSIKRLLVHTQVS